MATRRDSTRAAKQPGKMTRTRTSKSASQQRYPDWKVQLFQAGIVERRNSSAGQMSGRAMRAPGA